MNTRQDRLVTPLPEGFHGDLHLQTLVDALAGRVAAFVESGAGVGSTLGYVARRYPALRALSCEPSEAACELARKHAGVRAGVDVFHEGSAELRERLSSDHAALLDGPVLAWLDTHDYGAAWPLRDEVRFFTARCPRGFVLVDDFQVPGDARFGFDAYDGRVCGFERIAGSIASKVDFRLYYPAYAERTSPHHPLRGWGLVQFGPRGEELERLDARLPHVCRHADARIDGESRPAARTAAADAFARGEFADAVSLLRAELGQAPGSAGLWNDLGVCLAHLGEGRAALAALAQALVADPADADARANLIDVQGAMHSDGDGRPLPIAPGPWGRMVARDPYDDLAALVGRERPLVVDGGANRGGTVAKLRARFPDASIHAFEPIPSLAEHLRGRFAGDRGVSVHSEALAARDGEIELAIRSSNATSSALEPSALARRYQGAGVATLERIRVKARRLDTAIPAEDGAIDVLKLDVQGFELEALRGLGDRMADVRVVLAQVQLAALDDGDARFADVDAFLRGRGFRLFHLYDLWSQPDGQVTSGDALFINERFFAGGAEVPA